MHLVDHRASVKDSNRIITEAAVNSLLRARKSGRKLLNMSSREIKVKEYHISKRKDMGLEATSIVEL